LCGVLLTNFHNKISYCTGCT